MGFSSHSFCDPGSHGLYGGVADSVNEDKGAIVINYSDDGVGLSVAVEKGTGLLGIDRRARMINAAISYPDETTSKGFRCVIRFSLR